MLHHYISRSLADFAVKQERRDGTGSVKQVRGPFNKLLHPVTLPSTAVLQCCCGRAAGRMLLTMPIASFRCHGCPQPEPASV